MNSRTRQHILRAGKQILNTASGQVCTLRWETSSILYDNFRDEEISGTITYDYYYNVPCLVKTITGGEVKYGVWGSMEAGDLVIMVDRNLNIDNLNKLVVLIDNSIYNVIPDTPMPYGSLSGLVGEKGVYQALYCKYAGKRD